MYFYIYSEGSATVLDYAQRLSVAWHTATHSFRMWCACSGGSVCLGRVCWRNTSGLHYSIYGKSNTKLKRKCSVENKELGCSRDDVHFTQLRTLHADLSQEKNCTNWFHDSFLASTSVAIAPPQLALSAICFSLCREALVRGVVDVLKNFSSLLETICSWATPPVGELRTMHMLRSIHNTCRGQTMKPFESKQSGGGVQSVQTKDRTR